MMATDDAPRPGLEAALLDDIRQRVELRDRRGWMYAAVPVERMYALLAAAAERDKLARQIAIACDDAADDLAFIAGYVDTCFDQRPADEWPSWLDMDVVRRRAQAGLERLGDRKRAVRAPEEGATDGE